MKRKYQHFATNAIRTQHERGFREHSVPLYLTSSFVFEDAEQARALFADEYTDNIYSRFSNPNTSEFIEKMCILEGMEDGFATATGMAAVFASMMPFLNKGDHILASSALFASTTKIIKEYMPNWGIEHSFFDINQPETWESLIQPNTKMIFAETPSNPGLVLIDMEHLCNIGKKHNVLVNIDNCFATPYLQQPAKYGADIITHSATKFLDGQGRVTGGVVLANKEITKTIRQFCRQTGPSLSPFNAWILSKSLETLHVRMDRHCQNALELAQWLETQEDIKKVVYPFLKSHPQYELAKKQMTQGGGVVTFEVHGGLERGRKFLDSLQLFSHTANLGDCRSIATHPASTTHSKIDEASRKASGIENGTIRTSIGLEHIDDIKADILQALEKSR
ncbi:MAG: aminotransferase class I/II-fold pyridoxal phosphate-dependent enzyme [Chitinophagales bacterium]|nr:aminotransferase class I/II-fold pyridoxal phosphate-dependent enzyme [Chitinophagales bacterium]MCB9074156.1 aminotransferase class I/II-fold pyridoxal phosphate-dependent enzyme [Chitinophagales bacterium]HMW95414.1 aminotransferase class I/II-fold pyridoxal phosphate-dependent enzyme [Chitinophagales bacterium]HNB38890.1 aminotransferase class I/II-fold pyridoxal phosphate-dependent enzyme [Chitinophagales bacterium]HNC64737.1 aminotransferase class I/II-fold pyridoxal phosphate-dependent